MKIATYNLRCGAKANRRVREFGLISCWQAANPNRDLPQTLRWSRDQAIPYHCDGIFVPDAWYRCLDQCEVLASPLWEELSDHNPVVATFSEEPAPICLPITVSASAAIPSILPS